MLAESCISLLVLETIVVHGNYKLPPSGVKWKNFQIQTLKYLSQKKIIIKVRLEKVLSYLALQFVTFFFQFMN